MLRSGAANHTIARELGLDKATPARYRAALGMAPVPRSAPNRCTLTLDEKFRQFVRVVDGGHMEWVGRHTKSSGTPVFSFAGRTVTARTVAFQLARGGAPEGYVTTECDHEGCVAPEHVEDEPGRNRLRAQLAALTGQESTRTACVRGHAAAEHRRYLPNGSPYCGTCQDMAKAAGRAAA
ncbi:hypothetical protein OG357_23100 [Streptomyces sp. NBC_01255]|uniref:hypothetical protein n=1 Tax=Streptomyces sp. NBC_01255 TaxID=2903798 RepID=UPI002E31BE86|nr:hypothetical protein [Streptomyces sp. NBC_01255]